MYTLLALSSLFLAHAVPLQLTQQGRVLDSSGSAVTGTQSVTFSIYDDVSSGTLLWTETLSVSFSNGYYAAVLGSDETSNPLDSDTLSQNPIYLEFQLGSNAPMSPRHPINSAPYAQMSGVSESVDGGSVNASDVSILGAPVIDSGGNWVGQPISVDWSYITTIPSYLTDGDDNTQLTESEVEGYVNNDGISLHEDTTLNGETILTESSTLEPEWLNIQSRPSGLDDGDDVLSSSDVVSYVESASINLSSGSQFNSRNLIGQPLSCSNGQVLIYNNSNNDWDCGDDTDTTLTPAEMQTAVEAMTLNLQNLPQVNGVDVLTADSTLNPSNIDATGSTSGQALISDGSTVQWGDINSSGCSMIGTINSSPPKHQIQCGSEIILFDGSSLLADTLGQQNGATQMFHCAIDTSGNIQCWGNYETPPSGSFSSLTLGTYSGCAINTSGSVECWGNSFSSPSTSSLFSQIEFGYSDHACGITTTGTVECWGSDNYGQVSNAASGTFSDLAIGYNHSCGLKTDGTAHCWGYDGYGQVSNTPSSTFSSLVSGSYFTCGLTTTDTVECWGSITNQNLALLGTPSGILQIEANAGSICVLEGSGSVVCSNGSTITPSNPLSSITMGGNFVCGISSTGAECSGNSLAKNNAPSNGSFIDIEANNDSVCGMLQSGNILCWGNDTYGQLSPP